MNSYDTNTSIINSDEKQIVSTFTGFLAGKVQYMVNARDLHQFLGSKKDFSSWLKNRINEYKFNEEQDFISFTQIGEREVGATTRKEYHISLDMAKELSMVERTERGRKARQYFIAMEQKAVTTHNNLAELNSRLKDGIFSHNMRYRQMYRYLQKELTHEEIARCMQILTRMVRNLYREMRDLELLPSQEIFVLAHTGRISRLASPKQLGLEV